MKFEEVFLEYQNLKQNLLDRKQAIIKRNLEDITRLDSELVVIIDKIKKIDISNNDFTKEEKEQLKSLGKEIKKLEENNEMLIKHSLDVINNTLSGIFNIIIKDKNTYNSKGLNCNEDETPFSSIVEEA